MTHFYKIKVCDNCGEKFKPESDKWFNPEPQGYDWLKSDLKWNHKCKDGKIGTVSFKKVTVED